MRAQVAFEYMVIVGMVMLFLIPMWIYISGVQQGASSQISISYAENAVNKIVSHADLVNSQGPPAKITSTLYIPPGVQEINFVDTTVHLRLLTSDGQMDILGVANVNITGTLPTREGNYQLRVEAVAGGVSVSVL